MEMTRETEVNRYPKNDIPQGQQMVMVTLSRELGEERDDDEQLMGLGMYRGEKGSVCLWLAHRRDAAAALAQERDQKNGAGEEGGCESLE
jgi:GH24 family phage-related lysozyme (muramidase)